MSDSVSNDGSPHRDVSIVQAPPSLRPHPLLQSLPPATLLPTELIDLLNRTYLLHLLANDPSKVLPPGKSVLSMMAKPHAHERRNGELPTLHEKVEEVIHKAFWDEALDTLSSPEPSIQLRRLKALYGDLHAVLKPLLPASHTVLITLSSPLSPTSSPLLSSITHLREIIAALKERCAPARDAYIDTLQASLDAQPSAQLVVDTIRSLLRLADIMKDDLTQFVLGTMGEQQLRNAVREQARMQECKLVLELWKHEVIGTRTKEWVDELSPPYAGIAGRRWVVRLVQALGASTAVACPLPTKPLSPEDGSPPPIVPNALPPPFFFSTPEIQYIQNFLQAIVIASALRALLPTSAPAHEFTRRVWTLLLTSVNEEPDGEATKILNLADELVRAAPADADPARLRAAVERTLQDQDPVFLLLRKRLLVAVATRLAPVVVAPPTSVPAEMHAGRERPGKRMKLAVDGGHADDADTPKDEVLAVKGFEELVLVEAIKEGVGKLRTVIRWVESGWREFLEPLDGQSVV
ncbi:hypothetical protein BV25DRAFT_1883416 [Artomyces pyxidatus]|uniref:Uncharacterized protein n=1 Tax=Artomyces pyxidatus TaxID=48021 RepID=A0ACB8T6I0_9AGAM|nr:hypothetical protein BV25DRAFT_1883416 [Artomyces pyxidatus]